MRTKLGVLCMVLGAALVFGALSLFLHNQREAKAAEEAVVAVMPQIVEQIELQQEAQAETPMYPQPEIPNQLLTEADLAMTEVEIDGYAYIGYLSIPTLGLELPVMADWDYNRLKVAPCRYYGTLKGDNLVIMAHNYVRHFKALSKLTTGDEVLFVDMDGNATRYQIEMLDILSPAAVEEMTAGDFDLTLFTCTYSGKERVTVYCNRTKNE